MKARSFTPPELRALTGEADGEEEAREVEGEEQHLPDEREDAEELGHAEAEEEGSDEVKGDAAAGDEEDNDIRIESLTISPDSHNRYPDAAIILVGGEDEPTSRETVSLTGEGTGNGEGSDVHAEKGDKAEGGDGKTCGGDRESRDGDPAAEDCGFEGKLSPSVADTKEGCVVAISAGVISSITARAGETLSDSSSWVVEGKLSGSFFPSASRSGPTSSAGPSTEIEVALLSTDRGGEDLIAASCSRLTERAEEVMFRRPTPSSSRLAFSSKSEEEGGGGRKGGGSTRRGTT